MINDTSSYKVHSTNPKHYNFGTSKKSTFMYSINVQLETKGMNEIVMSAKARNNI